jgi:hypothetical protein
MHVCIHQRYVRPRCATIQIESKYSAMLEMDAGRFIHACTLM